MKLFKQSQKAISMILVLSALAANLAGCGRPGAGNGSSEAPSLPTAAELPPTAPSAERDIQILKSVLPDIENPTIESPEDFYACMISTLLNNTEGENRVCSPVNLYMALAMLSETTSGESRTQLLSLLGETETLSLRSYVEELWEENCRDSQISTLRPAASLWADKSLSLKKDTVKTLSKSHHASVRQGKMDSDKLNREFQKWLSENTGGLLDQQISGHKFSDETVLALASTLYYKGRWQDEFSKKATADAVFHAAEEDITCAFMNRHTVMNYYRGDSFAAISLPFADGCDMWLLLPDEDSSTEELLQDGSGLTGLVMRPSEWEDVRFINVNMSIPKFDVAWDTDLTGQLKQMGVTDVFDPNTADFSAILSDTTPAWLSQVNHAARVRIDEEGCEAAAYTSMALCGAAMSREQADFIADRPFVFVITGAENVPMFAGLVNRP